jgi:hypothetical protein
MRAPSKAYIVAMSIALMIGLAVIINVFNSSPDSGTSALVERTCEIVRDITGDGDEGVNTVSETQDRLQHLLDGYGVRAPADIQAPLRDSVAATSEVVLDASLGRLESACSMRGL